MKKILVTIFALTLSITAFCACGDKDDDWKKDKDAGGSSLALPAEDNSKAYADDARVIYSAANTSYVNMEVAGSAPRDGDVTVDFENTETNDAFIKGIYQNLDADKYTGKCIVHLMNEKVSYVEYMPNDNDKAIYPKEEVPEDSSSTADSEAESKSDDVKSGPEKESMSEEEMLKYQNEYALEVYNVIDQYCRDAHDKGIELKEMQYSYNDSSDLAKYVNENIKEGSGWKTFLETGSAANYKNGEQYMCPTVVFATDDNTSHFIGKSKYGNIDASEAPFKGTIDDIELRKYDGERGRFINDKGELTEGDVTYDVLIKNEEKKKAQSK